MNFEIFIGTTSTTLKTICKIESEGTIGRPNIGHSEVRQEEDVTDLLIENGRGIIGHHEIVAEMTHLIGTIHPPIEIDCMVGGMRNNIISIEKGRPLIPILPIRALELIDGTID